LDAKDKLLKAHHEEKTDYISFRDERMNKEGLVFEIPALILVFSLFAAFSLTQNVLILAGALVSLILFVFLLFFFRDPERKAPEGENLILAPADGRVILTKPFDNLEFVGGGGTLVSLFMSLFDVHVNRVPVSGVVRYFKYNPGRFFPAFKEKDRL
jgi:phosphatidylserine decarboxylase